MALHTGLLHVGQRQYHFTFFGEFWVDFDLLIRILRAEQSIWGTMKPNMQWVQPFADQPTFNGLPVRQPLNFRHFAIVKHASCKFHSDPCELLVVWAVWRLQMPPKRAFQVFDSLKQVLERGHKASQ